MSAGVIIDRDKDRLDRLIKMATDHALHELKADGSLRPTMIADIGDGFIVLSPDTMDGEQDKDRFTTLMRIIAVAHDPVAMVMVSEAWMIRAPASGIESALSQPPSEMDREEVVIISGQSRVTTVMCSLPIVRLDNRTFWNLGDPDCMYSPVSSGATTGRFCNFLPERRPTDVEKTAGRQLLESLGIKL